MSLTMFISSLRETKHQFVLYCIVLLRILFFAHSHCLSIWLSAFWLLQNPLVENSSKNVNHFVSFKYILATKKKNLRTKQCHAHSAHHWDTLEQQQQNRNKSRKLRPSISTWNKFQLRKSIDERYKLNIYINFCVYTSRSVCLYLSLCSLNLYLFCNFVLLSRNVFAN